ncbi:hypothetical protein [Neolewinella sp.]|uniref:hypothetical protein n=1 Tax=Neolewinella sp. TaxID=2993543 RepID=UPI003B52735D
MTAVVDRIIASKSFGRSVTYANLLRYLVACSESGDPPKEVTIAADILGKHDFDSSQSSLVRVHIYKLRKKLAAYYAREGAAETIRLRIPKGSYAITYEGVTAPAAPPPETPPPAPMPDTARRRRSVYPVLLVTLVLGAVLTAWWYGRASHTPPAPPPFWVEIFESPRPKQLLIGDLLMYEDTLAAESITLRNGGVNSREEFDRYRSTEGDAGSRYRLLSYGLVMRNSTLDVKYLTELFTAYGSDFEIATMSRFNPRELAGHDLIVTGMLKTHGLFRTYFPRARLQLSGPDTLTLTQADGSRRTFTTSGDPDRRHTDYGLIRKTRGPNGTVIVVAGGLWDTASAQMVKTITQPTLLAELTAALETEFGTLPERFEVLYRVEGIDRMELRPELIWMGELDE